MKFPRLSQFFSERFAEDENVQAIQEQHHNAAKKELDSAAMKIDQKLEEVKSDLDEAQGKIQEILDDEVMKSREAKSKFRPNLRVF